MDVTSKPSSKSKRPAHNVADHVCFESIAPALRLTLHDHISGWFRRLARRHRNDPAALPLLASANFELRQQLARFLPSDDSAPVILDPSFEQTSTTQEASLREPALPGGKGTADGYFLSQPRGGARVFSKPTNWEF